MEHGVSPPPTHTHTQWEDWDVPAQPFLGSWRGRGRPIDGFHCVYQFRPWFFRRITHSSVAEPYLLCIVVDDHGREAVVGRRDANWAHGISAFTSSWLLLVARAAGAFVVNQIALVLSQFKCNLR